MLPCLPACWLGTRHLVGRLCCWQAAGPGGGGGGGHGPPPPPPWGRGAPLTAPGPIRVDYMTCNTPHGHTMMSVRWSCPWFRTPPTPGGAGFRLLVRLPLVPHASHFWATRAAAFRPSLPSTYLAAHGTADANHSSTPQYLHPTQQPFGAHTDRPEASAARARRRDRSQALTPPSTAPGTMKMAHTVLATALVALLAGEQRWWPGRQAWRCCVLHAVHRVGGRLARTASATLTPCTAHSCCPAACASAQCPQWTSVSTSVMQGTLSGAVTVSA